MKPKPDWQRAQTGRAQCSGEKENISNGVAYCPHCDGPFYKAKILLWWR